LANTATHAAAFTESGNGETPLAEWSHEYTALLQDLYAHRAAVEIAGVMFDENFTRILKLQRRINGGDFPGADSWFAAARDFLNWAASERQHTPQNCVAANNSAKVSSASGQ
jgi:hypothetical protein